MTDCLVTMIASGHLPRQSKPHQKFDKSISSAAGDFRKFAPVAVLAALAKARTRVCGRWTGSGDAPEPTPGQDTSRALE